MRNNELHNKIEHETLDDQYQYLQRWLNWEAYMMIERGEIK